MTNFVLEGWLNEPSNITVTVGGTQIFSGDVTGNVGETIDLCSFNAESPASVSVTTNSGSCKSGQVRYLQTTWPAWDDTSTYAFQALVAHNVSIWEATANIAANSIPGINPEWKWLCSQWSPDKRTSIELDGAAPAWPAAEPYPGGTPENPDWSGWFFDVNAGNTLTFTVSE